MRIETRYRRRRAQGRLPGWGWHDLDAWWAHLTHPGIEVYGGFRAYLVNIG